MTTPYPLQWIAGLASAVLPYIRPVHPHRVVLTSFHGDGYRGNTKVLFEHLIDHETFEPVWLSRNHTLVQDLKDRFGPEHAAKAHFPAGLTALAEARALFLTHGTSDYPFLFLPRHALRIQTYHGLPTKRGEYLRPHADDPPNWMHRQILKYRFEPITHFLSSSSQVTDVFSARFGLPKARFVETGFPSYDALMNRTVAPFNAHDFWPNAPAAESLILYAPTFRKVGQSDTFPYRTLLSAEWFPFEDLNIEHIAQFLDEHQAILALRPHPNEQTSLKRFTSASPRIVYAGQEAIEDVNELILRAHAIITDYSSIYIEGLLKDVPPVFVPYDQATYERGFAIPYEEVTPGPKVHRQQTLLTALEEALQGAPTYEEERKRVRDLFFAETDGRSTERVVQMLEDELL